MIGDVNFPRMGKLEVYGVLEVDNDKSKSFQLRATYIYIRGGRIIVGSAEKPFLGDLSIVLLGDHSTRDYDMPESGPTMGSKVIGE